MITKRSTKAEIRSKIMASIRGKDTSPELLVRKQLHRVGMRFRVQKRVNGIRPDMVLPKYHAIVLVNGCFWHHHQHCKKAGIPKVRRKFWIDKFEANIKRDKLQREILRRGGWRVATVWECSLSESKRKRSLARLENWIRRGQRSIEIG